MSKKLTHDEYVERVRLIRGNEFEILSEYKGGHKSITLRHDISICGHVWRTSAGHIINKSKSGCPKCSHKQHALNQTLTVEEFMERIKKRHGEDIILLGEYTGTHNTHRFKHNVEECGYEWETKASNVISQGSRCPVCSAKERAISRRLSQQQFKEKLKYAHFGEIIALDEYITTQTKMRFQHNIENCNHIWSASPSDIIYGKKGCPSCYASKGEKLIRRILKEYDVEFFEQHKFSDCKNIKRLPFDFAIFMHRDLLFLIEYQGIHHYKSIDFLGGESELKQRQINDSIKRTYCAVNNIRLLEIPYWLSESAIRDVIDITINETMTPYGGHFYVAGGE